MRPLTIGFVNIDNAADPHYLSGAPYAVRQELIRTGCDVVDLFPIPRTSFLRSADRLGRIAGRVSRKLGRHYDYTREPRYCSAVARQVDKLISDRPLDALFTQRSVTISRLNTPIPIFSASDQPYPCLYEGYVGRPFRRGARIAEEQSIDSIRRSAKIFVPSQWARDRFIHYFPESERKLCVIPWGANLGSVPSEETILGAIDNRFSTDALRLCFVGKDWARKGGPVVLKTAELLASRGVRVELTIIGSQVAASIPNVSISNIRFMDRFQPSEAARFQDILLQSHFMFVPSVFEAYGHVFCEASAFGVPSISRDTGGVAEIIGKNGACLPRDSSPLAFATRIDEIFRDRDLYARMARQARADYDRRLNWTTFTSKMLTTIRDCIASTKGELAPKSEMVRTTT